MAVIPGVGKDARTVADGNGTTQAALPYRFDDLDPLAMFRMAQIMATGRAKYGPPADNWRKIATVSHVNHALSHLFAWLAGDESDDHLGHAACRAMGALQTALQGHLTENTPAKPEDTVGSLEGNMLVTPEIPVCVSCFTNLGSRHRPSCTYTGTVVTSQASSRVIPTCSRCSAPEGSPHAITCRWKGSCVISSQTGPIVVRETM